MLVAEMERKALDPAPIWSDLETFDGKPWRGVVDIIIAGLPCQPFSTAGHKQGFDDPRHLWPAAERIVREVAPAAIVLEQVPGALKEWMPVVAGRLVGMGYRIAAGIFSAREIGASHIRERVFAVCVSDVADASAMLRDAIEWRKPDGNASAMVPADSLDGRIGATGQDWAEARDPGDALGDLHGEGLEGRCCGPEQHACQVAPFPPGPRDDLGWREYLGRWPDAEPAILPRPDGPASTVDRLRAIGQGVVPLAAAHAFVSLAAELLGE